MKNYNDLKKELNKNNEFYIDLKNGFLINDDCLKILKELPDKCIDLVLIDPPYNMSIKGEKWDKWKNIKDYKSFMYEIFKEVKRVLKLNGNFYFFHNDMLYISDFILFLTKEIGMEFKDFITWKKGNFKTFSWKNPKDPNNLQKWFQITEYIVRFTHPQVKTDQLANVECYKETRRYMNECYNKSTEQEKETIKKHFKSMWGHYCSLGTCQFYTIPEDKYNELQGLSSAFYLSYNELKEIHEKEKEEYNEKKQELDGLYKIQHYLDPLHHNVWETDGNKYMIQGHPTAKPLEFLQRLIRTSTKEGDIVLDFFNGSGSTFISTIKENRKYIGVELEEKYCELTRERLEKEGIKTE